ncbi:MAG: ABC transporter permease [Lactobacillales bacterium]|jgi:oligopeptide transport system permease protein|nr:ABC transporter permease [Lactobacillales bacterium]
MSENKFTFVELDDFATEHIDAPHYSYWRSVFRKFLSSKLAIAMLILMVVIIALSFIQPIFSHYDFMDVTNINNFELRYNHPSLQHLFGTDKDGQDLFDVVWAGAKNSILISVLATFVTIVIGVIVGAVWGFSRAIDKIMVEVYNVVSNVPFLLIVMVLAFAFGAGFWNLLFAMTVTSWVGMAFYIRTQVMIIRDREYNLASQTLGTSTFGMIKNNVLPFLVSVIVMQIANMIPSFISTEVFLSYLGIGLKANVPSLGRTMSTYSSDIVNNGYLFWIPLAVLAAISISVFLVGQTLADASDPRTHNS